MSLCGRPPYQKGQDARRSRGSAREANAAEKRLHDQMRELGCAVCGSFAGLTIHHCGTGGGGRKDHGFVIPLCHHHHQGEDGLDRKGGLNCPTKRRYSRPGEPLTWQERHGSERELFEKTLHKLEKFNV